MNWELWGIVAGTVTSAGFVPQIIKGYRTKHLKDISYGMNILLLTGFSMWLAYGISQKSVSIISANVTGITFNLVLAAMKHHYGRKHQHLNKAI
ncbi:TPA: hypothetical protein HA231_04745 [Candidatus Woesearchaeota archaeon]|nr:hypothetical protein [Candidatus Woesearchaeota archaeon]